MNLPPRKLARNATKFENGRRVLVYSKTDYALCRVVSSRWHRGSRRYRLVYLKTNHLLIGDFEERNLLPYMSKSAYWMLIINENFQDGTWNVKRASTFILRRIAYPILKIKSWIMK